MKHIRGAMADSICQSDRKKKKTLSRSIKLKVLLRVNQWPPLCLETESFLCDNLAVRLICTENLNVKGGPCVINFKPNVFCKICNSSFHVAYQLVDLYRSFHLPFILVEHFAELCSFCSWFGMLQSNCIIN